MPASSGQACCANGRAGPNIPFRSLLILPPADAYRCLPLPHGAAATAPQRRKACPMTTPLKIDFVSDVSCPWCVIGLKSLEQALGRLEGQASAEIHFQPFELNP